MVMEGPTKKATSKDASSSVPPPPWIDLPRDLTTNILQRLSQEEMLDRAQHVCRTWRDVCREPSMWRKIHLKHHHCPWIRDWETMCRHAVDYSQGQLVEITLAHFGTDMLLGYIAERSSQLRCLKLFESDQLTEEGVLEAIRRLPLLETLYIDEVEIYGQSIEQVGRSCPMLKSLTLYNPGSLSQEYRSEDDIDAFAIAKSMPELLSLQLASPHPMTNKGLEAILDGCPHLESVYLHLRAEFDLSGDLGQRCSQQIKSLMIFDDTTTDDDSDFDDDDDDDAAD